jgi:hypothetical protein
MADSALRIFDVTVSSRDKVNMAVEDCLARGFTGVDTDIESLYGSVALLRPALQLL